jgi:hypothetical protein
MPIANCTPTKKRLHFVIPTGAYPDFPPRSPGHVRRKCTNATNLNRKSGVA